MTISSSSYRLVIFGVIDLQLMHHYIKIFTVFLLLFGGGREAYAQQLTNDSLSGFLSIHFGDLKSADINGDGEQDLIVNGNHAENSYTFAYLNYGDHFEYDQTNLPAVLASSIALGDIDNDGDVDAFFSGLWEQASEYSGVFINDGTGHFTECSLDLERVQMGESAFFDANGDGYLDLFYFGKKGFNTLFTKLYINDGTGEFTDTPVAIEGFNRGSLSISDYDKDGDQDILISGEIESVFNVTKLFNNDGTGCFTEAAHQFVGICDGTVVFSDIDLDSDMDIILNGRKNGIGTYHSEFYINDGTGQFTDVGNRGLDSLGGNNLALGDVDLDGDDDIFLGGRNKSGQDTCAIYFNIDGFFVKDTNYYAPGLAHGASLFLLVDHNCSPDLAYSGLNLATDCQTHSYLLLNKNTESCPETEEPGIEAETTLLYHVFSNPFRNQIKVEVSDTVLLAQVYDARGRLVYEYAPDLSLIEIDLGSMQTGIYLLRFVTVSDLQSTTIRLLKLD